jgi:hypothetical protein
MFALTVDLEYLLDECVNGMVEVLDEVTGKAMVTQPLYGMF